MIKVILLIITLFTVKFNQNYTFVDKEINVFKEVVIKKEKEEPVLAVYKGNITAYGPDCIGCSGITASGYNVHNNIYYNDKKYGKVRIVAADKSLPFGTIVRIRDLNVFNEPVLAIVLDRGSAIGFNRKVYFDLLYKKEKYTLSFGKRKATFEILRMGY